MRRLMILILAAILAGCTTTAPTQSPVPTPSGPAPQMPAGRPRSA